MAEHPYDGLVRDLSAWVRNHPIGGVSVRSVTGRARSLTPNFTEHEKPRTKPLPPSSFVSDYDFSKIEARVLSAPAPDVETGDITIEDAQKILDQFNQTFPQVALFHTAIRERSRCYVRQEADTEAR